jgi:hypothetical protein
MCIFSSSPLPCVSFFFRTIISCANAGSPHDGSSLGRATTITKDGSSLQGAGSQQHARAFTMNNKQCGFTFRLFSRQKEQVTRLATDLAHRPYDRSLVRRRCSVFHPDLDWTTLFLVPRFWAVPVDGTRLRFS